MFKAIKLSLAAVALGAASPAMASNILISESPWGQNRDISNMTDVFGGNFSTYTSYATATASDIFNGSNAFVFLEGGDRTDLDLQSYLTSNTVSILSWVSGGGHLLIQTAGNSGPYTFSFGAATFTNPAYNGTGTLTAAGQANFTAFPTPTTQSGTYLAHDVITGVGLTSFMTGGNNGDSIIAGAGYGSGYILYSGLTDSQFHSAGNGLVDNEIAFTAAGGLSAVPLPASAPLFGAAIAVLGMLGFGMKRKQASAA